MGRGQQRCTFLPEGRVPRRSASQELLPVLFFGCFCRRMRTEVSFTPHQLFFFLPSFLLCTGRRVRLRGLRHGGEFGHYRHSAVQAVANDRGHQHGGHTGPFYLLRMGGGSGGCLIVSVCVCLSVCLF